MKSLLLFFLAVIVSASGAEILPTERQYTWTGNVGIPGGIPDVTTIYTNLTPSGGNDVTQIQGAIDNCPSNQVVKLGAGTFIISSGFLDFFEAGDSGVVLRGSGTDQTTIRVDGVTGATAMLIRGIYNADTLATGVDVAITPIKGTNVITLYSAPSWIKVGHLYVIDQTNDSSFVTHGTTNIFEDGSDQRWKWAAGGTNWGHRGMMQLVKVTSISGTNITIDMPLVYAWDTNFHARFWKSTYDPDTSVPISRVGLEDFKITGTYTNTTDYFIKFQMAKECWIKNIESAIVPGLQHFESFHSYKCEVRDSYFHESGNYGAGAGYGVAIYDGCAGFLVENNRFDTLHAAIQVNYGSCANVFGYNAIFEGQDDNYNKSIVSLSGHGTHSHFNLFEGNWCANQVSMDVVHGSGSHGVFFRNRVVGTNHINDGESCINLDYYNRKYSVIGNILGSGEHTDYERIANATCSSTGTKVIWKLGYKNGYGCSSTCSGVGGDCYDNESVNDAIRAVNYDVVTATNSGVVLGGYQIEDLGTSYYLTSKPDWFGFLPYPSFGPDVGTSEAYRSPTNIAAGYLYVNGTNPPAAEGGSPINPLKLDGKFIMNGKIFFQ